MDERDRSHDFDKPVAKVVARSRKQEVAAKLDAISKALGQATAQPGNNADLAQALRNLDQSARVTYVVAGTHAEFLDWAKRTTAKNYTFVRGPESFVGVSGVGGGQVVFYGTWYARPDIVEVKQAIAMATTTYNGNGVGAIERLRQMTGPKR
jgi:hypothetical protein